MKLNNNRAFTLLELLMVILVVAVLAALAIPQMQSFAIRAQSVEAMTNVRALSDSLLRYYSIYGNFPIVAGGPPPSCLDTKVPEQTKYFRYMYGSGGIDYEVYADNNLYWTGNCPSGATWRYEIEVTNVPSQIVDGQLAVGEPVGNNLYKYLISTYMQPDRMPQRRPGW